MQGHQQVQLDPQKLISHRALYATAKWLPKEHIAVEYFVVAHDGPNVKGQDVGKMLPMQWLYAMINDLQLLGNYPPLPTEARLLVSGSGGIQGPKKGLKGRI